MMQLRKSELTWHVTGGEVVILDLEGSVYLRLNGTGRVLWELLAESCSDAELTKALTERYDVDVQLAADDVAGFLAELRGRGLLVS